MPSSSKFQDTYRYIPKGNGELTATIPRYQQDNPERVIDQLQKGKNTEERRRQIRVNSFMERNIGRLIFSVCEGSLWLLQRTCRADYRAPSYTYLSLSTIKQHMNGSGIYMHVDRMILRVF